MKLYKVKLELTSPFASDWQADTIWGHLCWVLRFAYGEEQLAKFIRRYDEEPPLLISNGFPGDLLPRPVIPEKPSENPEDYQKQKDQKKIRWLDAGEFERLRKGFQIDLSEKKDKITSVTLKNQINRLSGSTGGTEDNNSGYLFPFEEYHLDMVSIYLKVTDDFIETVEDLFQRLSNSGYGKRKTVGYGQFKVMSFEEVSDFSIPEGANGFVSLSNFVPAENDPIRGNWEILIKYGKLGEEYAITGNPHKIPLVMFEAGSCFYDNTIREYYGGLVKGLSQSYPNVVQYGYALPVPMVLT